MIDYCNSKIPQLFYELERRNMKPQELCKSLKISSSTMSDWKAGRIMPPAEKIIMIAEFLGVTTDYLLNVKTASDNSDKKIALNNAFQTLTEKEQDNVIAYIDFVKERR